MQSESKWNIELKQSNPYAAITVLVLVTIIFLGMYVLMKPFAIIYEDYTNNSEYSPYTNQTSCEAARGYWEGTTCQELPSKAITVLVRTKIAWLVAPFIFIVGLIIWYLTVATRRDPQHYMK